MLTAYSLVALMLLALEAWISMTESSFFSVPRLALERLKHELEAKGSSGAGRPLAQLRRIAQVESLLAQPSRLLGAILVADMLVSVSLSSVVALLSVQAAHRLSVSEPAALALGGGILLVVLLVFGEVLPKVFALRRSLRIALAFAPVAADLAMLLSPVSALLERLARGLPARVKSPPFPTDAELTKMIEVGRERGVIIGDESLILTNLVELGRRRVSEVMTPRIDVLAVEKDLSVADVVAQARQRRCSRIPVYDRTIDRVTGVFYVKDSFGLESDAVPVGTVARDAYHVPEVKPVLALLEEFRREGVHIAVVVDEFGQTAGVVTLEDVLEAIFGEINDEHDTVEELPWFQIDDKTWLVDGEIDLKALNRQFANAFRGERFERLSGLIHHLLGRLPTAGETIRFRSLQFEVRQVSGNAIEKVLIRKV